MDGSTGDAQKQIGGVLVDPQGESPLTALVESAGVDYQEMPAMLADLKVHAAVHTLASELRRLRRCTRRRPAPIIRCCPRRWLHCCATSDAIAVITPAGAAVLLCVG